MLKKIKLITGITDNDELLRFLLDSVTQSIINYCNVEELPVELENTAVMMAVDLCRSEQFGGAEAPQTVSSIAEGDTKVSFQVNPEVNSLIKNYTAQLNRFRRVTF